MLHLRGDLGIVCMRPIDDISSLPRPCSITGAGMGRLCRRAVGDELVVVQSTNPR